MSEVNITVGNTTGSHFCQGKFDELKQLAEELYSIFRINNFHLWYDFRGDWHNLEFDYDGHHYRVQLYKIKTLYREGERLPRYLPSPGFNHDVVNFFFHGKHKEPWPQPKP